jgi:hypothetical protein
MKELEKDELINTNGGFFGWDDFLVGIAVGAVLAIINDWDNFERGFTGQPYKAK